MLSSVHKGELIKHLIKQVETGIWLGKQYHGRSKTADALIQMTIIVDMVRIIFLK
jgi:hypothetical protein